jgi:triosephosphate isomerase
MRRPIIAGNWKMNRTAGEAVALIEALKPRVAGQGDVEIVVCPPFTVLAAAAGGLQGSPIALGAQGMFWKESGAYTGQISPLMLLDLGCRWVILGHSEARGRFGAADADLTPELRACVGETDVSVNRKTHAALRHGLTPIVCCGELLEERRAGRTDSVVAGQIERGLAGLEAAQVASLVLAYEPVWAIGTGEVCAAEEADRVCGHIRAQVRRLFGEEPASHVRIQYGGSVKPDNAGDLLRRPEIDGALVGGASLNAADFAAIVAAAR